MDLFFRWPGLAAALSAAVVLLAWPACYAGTDTRASLGAPLPLSPNLPVAELASAPNVSAAPAHPVAIANSDTASVDIAGASLYWFDTTEQVGIDDVALMHSPVQFSPLRPSAAQLLRGGALWVCFDVSLPGAALPAPRAWHLQLALPALDSATLYHRNASGLWMMQQAGDTLPMRLWPQAGRYPVFALSGHLPLTRYYLKIVHRRVPFNTPIQLLSQPEMTEQHEKDQFLLGAYFGLLALVTTLAALNAVIYRDRAFSSYALYLILLGGTVASSSGIGALYFWRDYPELSNASLFFLPLAVSAAALSFVRIVLRPRQFAPWLDRSLLALASLLLLVGAYDVIWPSLNGFAITNGLVLCSVLAFVVATLMSARQRNPYVRWLGLGFAPMVVVALLMMARNLEWLQLDIGTDAALMLASTWAVPVLFFGLNRRLAQRRESEVRARALMQFDALTGLARDRVLSVRLQGALLRARRTQQSFGLLVVDVSNVAALRREFGRSAAEQALVLAATRLQSVVRDVDTAARLGEQEFAVLIEAPCAAADLTQLATRLLAQSLRPSELLPPGATLKLHISMTTAPQGDLNETELLGHLLADVSRISPEHGKTISTCAF